MKPSERATVEALVNALLDGGYCLNIDDGGDDLAMPANSDDSNEVLEHLGTTSEQWLTVHDGLTKQFFGYVYLVFGNEDWVLIADYTSNLEDMVGPVCKWCERRDQRPVRIAVNYRHEFATAEMFDAGIDLDTACNQYAGDKDYWLADEGPISLFYWLCSDEGEAYFKGEMTIERKGDDDE